MSTSTFVAQFKFSNPQGWVDLAESKSRKVAEKKLDDIANIGDGENKSRLRLILRQETVLSTTRYEATKNLKHRMIMTAAGPACTKCSRGVGVWLAPDESPCECKFRKK